MTKKLDGDIADIGTRELKYTIPAPFGPDKGKAFVHITAKPASIMNAGYKAEKEHFRAQVHMRDLLRERQHKENGDDEEYIQSGLDNDDATGLHILEMLYDHCIVKWSTDLQRGGKSIKATKANYMDLIEVTHPAIVKMFNRFTKDVSEIDKWVSKATIDLEQEEVGNSKAS